VEAIGGSLARPSELLRAIAALVLLSAPSVAATATTGEFGIAGPATFEGPATLGGPLLAAYGRPEPQALLLQAARATLSVSVYEATYVDAGAGTSTTPEKRTLAFEVAHVTLVGAREGYLAILPKDGTRGTLTGDALRFEAKDRTTFGAAVVGQPADERTRIFSHTVSTPHLLANDFEASIGPRFALKLYGPTLIVETPEGREEFATGRFPDPMLPRAATGRDVWLVAEVAAEASIGRGADLALALGPSHVRWSDAVDFLAAHGQLQADGLHPLERPGRVRLEGDFEGRVEPAPPSAATLTFAGDLRRAVYPTGVVATGQTGPIVPPAGDLLLPGLGVLALGAVGALAVRALRGRRVRSARADAARMTPEDCLAEHARAVEAEDWSAALAWTRRARRLAPASARLAHDEAFALEQLDRLDAAFETYAEAAAMGTDGFADFGAARCAARLGRPRDEIVTWLARALEADPGLSIDVLADPDLAPLARDPRLADRFRRD